MRFNSVLDKKKLYIEYKIKIFKSPKNRTFPKGLTHAIGQNTNSLFIWFWSKQD